MSIFFQTYILFTRLFQWEKTSLTRKRLLVRIQYRVPYGAVAQLGEHFACTEGVVGSNSTSSTICGCSSIGRALRCQRKGFLWVRGPSSTPICRISRPSSTAAFQAAEPREALGCGSIYQMNLNLRRTRDWLQTSW